MIRIVLLHGWAMNPCVFDELRARLSPQCEVHALALPGYADTQPHASWTLDALAAHVAARAPERCCVAGWSLGGLIALTWARLKPRQVQRLVLLGTSPSFVRREGWNAAIAASVIQEFAVALERDRAGALRRFLSLQVQGDDAAMAVLRKLRACVNEGGIACGQTLARGLQLLLDSDLRGALPLIEQETLVIHGERDALVPVAAGELIARAVPAARFVSVPRAAHAPFISDVLAVSGAMREFCDER